MQSLNFLTAWRTRAQHWQGEVPAAPAILNSEWLIEALRNGEPLVAAVEPQVPGPLYASVLLDLLGVLQEYRPDPAQPSLAAAVMAADAESRRALAEAARAGDSAGLQAWAAAAGVSAELLITLAPLALQPFLARFAGALTQGLSLLTWRQPYCPICGREPATARIDGDNLRHLHCAQCDTQWQYHRLACIWCGAEDPKQVKILQVAEWDPWRLDICDACGGYLKTIDQRHGGQLARPSLDLFLEDARTRQLDVLAHQRGYNRGGRVQ